MADDVLTTVRITSHPINPLLAYMLNLSCAVLSLIRLLTFFMSDMIVISMVFLLTQLLTHILTPLATWLLDMSQTKWEMLHEPLSS